MNTFEDTGQSTAAQNSQPCVRTKIPLAGAILGGLFGGFAAILGVRILFDLGLLNPFTGQVKPGPLPVVLTGIVLVSVAPLVIILGGQEGLAQATRHINPMIALIGNALVWAGLGSFLHAALLHLASKRKRFRVRGKFVGALLLVLGAMIIGCSAERLASDECRPIKTGIGRETQDPACERLASRRIQVAIDGEAFELERKRVGDNWVFPSYAKDLTGRQNRLIGSRVVRLSYESDPPRSCVTVEIEGSLFTPREVYTYSQEAKLTPGSYALSAANGQHLNLELIGQLEYESCDSGASWLGPGMISIDIFP